jgi:hypothetical protein
MDEKDIYRDLAKRLACAWVSHKLRISLQYGMKRYVEKQEPGSYWYALANK